jgi:NB-ARC domain
MARTLVPDLDRMGIKPLFCFKDLGVRKDLNGFQYLIRRADQVIIVCTPELKKKCDERKKAPTGVALKIRLAQERYNNPDKYKTIFLLYVKGDRKSVCPWVFIEPILGTKFTYLEKSTEASALSYYSSAFELLGGMRKIPREQSRKIKEDFLKKVSLVLKGEADMTRLKRWREERASRHERIVQSVQERVSVNTQIVNLPLPPKDFRGREKELTDLHEKCSHQHRVAVTGLGGIGKTTLALNYANNYKAHYQFIHFMQVGNSQSVIDGLLKLADELHVFKTDKIEERLQWLKTTLERFEKEYLLIFDGIDQVEAFQKIEKYLPERGRCLLLTSRMPEEAKARKFEVIELQLFSLKEATEYLLKAIGSKEEKAAQKLAELLGRLPLVLSHAAGYIRSSKTTIEDYI